MIGSVWAIDLISRLQPESEGGYDASSVDLTLSPSEEAFRDELRSWLEANNPGSEPDGDEAGFEYRRAWQRTLDEAGWAGLSWPREYGGRGATLIEQAIFNEETARAHAPQVANVLGLAMGGPTVIAHGTEEQRRRYLPPILSAEEIWCQGFSEPESGSDLASVKTRAVRDGDEWVVTGQKVWTTFAHHAKWCMLVARTDPDAPKHKGLTYFLMDMEQDGVQVRPLRQITGEAEFNELFIEGARIPNENIVGGEGNGWAVAITTLMHERATLAFSLQVGVHIALGELLEKAREARGNNGHAASEDPVIRQRIAQLLIEAEALRLNAYRSLTATMRTGVPGPEGSLGKWHWSEINQSLTELAMEIEGPRAMLDSDRWTYRFLRARANSIEGGTTEILKNIVAERVLGLPRMR
jgi:alkylation response protein AidB-like acyl-CoA dehydrogenase